MTNGGRLGFAIDPTNRHFLLRLRLAHNAQRATWLPTGPGLSVYSHCSHVVHTSYSLHTSQNEIGGGDERTWIGFNIRVQSG